MRHSTWRGGNTGTIKSKIYLQLIVQEYFGLILQLSCRFEFVLCKQGAAQVRTQRKTSPFAFFLCFNVALLTSVHSTPFRSKESTVDCILSGDKIFANLFPLIWSGALLLACENKYFSH